MRHTALAANGRWPPHARARRLSMWNKNVLARFLPSGQVTVPGQRLGRKAVPNLKLGSKMVCMRAIMDKSEAMSNERLRSASSIASRHYPVFRDLLHLP